MNDKRYILSKSWTKRQIGEMRRNGMKKYASVFLLCALLIVAGVASAHGGDVHQTEKKLSVLVNGVAIEFGLKSSI